MRAQQAPYLKRILYIEDDHDTREMVGYMLEHSGYEVIAAESCRIGLGAARSNRPDLYIVDHTLPDGSGIDLCKQLRSFDQYTPIIFCSGYTDTEHQEAALDAGAQCFLAKPFDSVQLINLITKLS